MFINTDLEEYIKLLVFQHVIHIKTMCVFWGHLQGFLEENPKILLPTDSQGNTIVQRFYCITYVTQGYFEENPEELLTANDYQGNTIAHLVTASGNTEVFEVFVYLVTVINVVM